MTVFMPPAGEPFYTGTYVPPDDGHGRPGFKRVLESLAAAWVGERDDLIQSAGKVAEYLRNADAGGSAGGMLPADAVNRAVAHLHQSFDIDWGGFGGAPKFPNPGNLEFLLGIDQRMAGKGTRELVTTTLDAMAGGGIYDQLGGGFARYSVDERWLVPHFEKMLYDNAQLVRLYTHAYQVTGSADYERVVRETLGYILREMTSPEGGF